MSHYDARAHLVVARRVFDNLLPGWQQIGAIWLPLPHVLNMIPVQIDALYRTGASAIALSVMSMGIATWAFASIVLRTTESVSAAAAGGILLMANPNLLYLQSTPMTEPLLFATSLVAVMLTAKWIDDGAPLPPRAAGLAVVAACMTRYEAWPIAAAIMVLAALALLRRRMAANRVLIAIGGLALYPGIAIGLFILNSRWTTGHWFLTSGFFVPENASLGHPSLAWQQVREGAYQLSGTVLVRAAYGGAALLACAFALSAIRASLVLILAPAAGVLLPCYAYLHGHPLRIRYSLPAVMACAVIAAAAVGLLPRRLRPLAAASLVGAAILQAPPLLRTAPMIVEAQREAQKQEGRRAVTAYLVKHYDGTPIMMSMGSLAHYMHELSQQGFAIRNFLHEGSNELWVYARALGPRGFVRWVVIEEEAEGGDDLYHDARRNTHFFDGFERVAEGGGVALYRGTEK